MVILTNPRADSIPGRRGALMNDRQRVKPLHHQWVTRYDIKIVGDIMKLKINTPECFGKMDGKPFAVTHHWIAHTLHDVPLNRYKSNYIIYIFEGVNRASAC